MTLVCGPVERFSDFFALNDYSSLITLSPPQFSPLARSVFKGLHIEIPPGESAKTLSQAEKCWQQMTAASIDRKAALIAIGGGSTSDLAGFVASNYLRGIDCFFIPTTLLAMVDAAIGGKNGVNFEGQKNKIGSFHLPKGVLIDTAFLGTLPAREYASGMAEVIKYSVIGDEELFERLEESSKLESEWILRCAKMKESIVSVDPLDKTGERALLNYGHTLGHALEALSDYSMLHGEAVAVGMHFVALVALHLGLCDDSFVLRQKKVLESFSLPTFIKKQPVEPILALMKRDKKGEHGKINLILPQRVGKVIRFFDVDPGLVEKILWEISL